VSRQPLTSVDAAERAQIIRLGVLLGIPALFLLSLLDLAFFARGQIGPGLLLALLLLNLPLTLVIVYGVWWAISGYSRGLVQVLLGAGNLAPDPQYSSQESLVARGFYREAAEAYRSHLLASPNDHAARIKLAAVEFQHLNNPAAAERLYLEVRAGRPDPRHDAMATNLLIELYRTTGQRGRLMTELARYAARHRGTRAGENAARALREMKAEGE
jgi:hypothetical protein